MLTKLTSLVGRWIGPALLVILMGACTFPWGTPPEPSTIKAPEGIPSPLVESPAVPTGIVEVSKPAPPPGTVMRWIDQSDFVYVPGGEFRMGQDSTDPVDFKPAHLVNLSGFWIHQAEVTNRQYASCVQAGVCSVPFKEPQQPDWYNDPQRTNDPVVGVTWDQAQAYCGWIKGRLPTEAEWELTARGNQSLKYPWGEATPTCDLLNYKDCFKPPELSQVRAYPDGVSPFMAFDLAGNVFEWVQDWYAADYYSQSPYDNPLGPMEGKERVLRGGGYTSPVEMVLSIVRYQLDPNTYRADLGFRCVLLGNAPPPACELLSLHPESPEVSITPETRPPVPTVVAYCDPAGGWPLTGINISLASETDPRTCTVAVSDHTIDCMSISGDPPRLNCYGPELPEDLTVSLQVCCDTSSPGPVPEPVCPAGYVYDWDTNTCIFGYPTPGEEGCPKYYVEYGGVCLPVPGDSGCAPGSYSVTVDGSTFCMPLDECLVPGLSLDPSCSCLEGFTYVPELHCCTLGDRPPVCPVGTYYHEEDHSCWREGYIPSRCNTLSVYIPACSTPTPHRPGQNCFCCQFTSSAECNSHANDGCGWVTLGSTSYCSGP